MFYNHWEQLKLFSAHAFSISYLIIALCYLSISPFHPIPIPVHPHFLLVSSAALWWMVPFIHSEHVCLVELLPRAHASGNIPWISCMFDNKLSVPFILESQCFPGNKNPWHIISFSEYLKYVIKKHNDNLIFYISLFLPRSSKDCFSFFYEI